MIVSLNDLSELRRKLSLEFWSGNRWLAFDNSNPYIGVRNIKCFEDIREANMYCQRKSATGQLYLVKALGSVLKVFNCGFGWQNENAAAKLKMLLSCFPITSFRSGDDLICSLLTGEYYPVIWSKIAYPLSVIDTYHIFECNQVSKTQHKIREQAAFASDSITEALKRFNKQTGLVATTREGVNADILLIGQFRNKTLKLDAVGFPEINTGLLLYTAHVVLDEVSERNVYRTILAHDLSVPVIIKQGVIVKYDIIKGKLDFFDSRLRKVQPGGAFDYLDLAFFAYQQPIKVAGM